MTILLLLQLRSNVTKSLHKLAQNVTDLARASAGRRNHDGLARPLAANAAEKSSKDMRGNEGGMRSAQGAARSAEMMAGANAPVTSLIDNMPCLCFSKDAKTGTYLACNRAFANYAHKDSPQGVVGLTDADIFDADTARHFVEDDQRVLSMDGPYTFFEDTLDATGVPRRFQTTKLKFVDDTGRLCTLGMCLDVTEIMRIERENVRTKAAYEKALNTNLVYSHMAQTLARGYTNFFHVNLETGEFAEYRLDEEHGAIVEVRRGGDFFGSCEQESKLVVHPDDLGAFTKSMAKTALLDSLNRSGSFMMTYRLLEGDGYIYVSMKISRMEEDEHCIIIGVTNVDEQMKQQKAAERASEERITFARITALTGDYLCIYTIDPQTERYREYSATALYEHLGLAKDGENFFETARENGMKVVHPDDLGRFLALFTKEGVLSQIKLTGIFALRYRLIINGKYIHTSLKAVLVDEAEGPRLIVGINDIDSHVQQEEEYERRLTLAQNKANRDALTNVMSRHAYLDAEEKLDRLIAEKRSPKFAIVIMDVNNLKQVNDTAGHHAGDKYLQDASGVIRGIFQNSTIYRVGGDEFVAIAQDEDYERIDELLAQMDEHNDDATRGGGIVIARGMARFHDDASVAPVFERADLAMYENKSALKAGARRNAE